MISGEKVPVYAQMTTERPALRVLEKDEVVVIGLVLFGDEVTWCAVSRPGETKRLGYISCEFVEPEKAGAAEGVPARPPESKPEIRVRAVEAPQPIVRELTAQPVAIAAVEPPLPRVRELAAQPVAIAVVESPLSKVSELTAQPVAIAVVESPLPKVRELTAQPVAIAVVESPLPKVRELTAQPVAIAVVESPLPKVRELTAQPVAIAAIEPPVLAVAPLPQADAVPLPPQPAAAAVPAETVELLPPAVSVPLFVATHAGPPVEALLPPEPPVEEKAPEPAAPQPVLPADFARGALEASSLKSQIALFVRASHAMSFLDKNRLATVDLEALGQIFHKHFRPGVFQWPVQTLLQKEAQAPEAIWLSDWLNDAATARMERLARDAAEPAAHARLVEYAANMRKSPPSQERLRLVHRLYAATQACDIEVETTLATVRALAEALNPLLPEQSRFGSPELARALQQVRKAYQPVMKNAKLVHYLFAFEPASDEELEQYVKGWESSGGRWWVAIQRKAFASGTRTLAANLRAAVPRVLGTSGLLE